MLVSALKAKAASLIVLIGSIGLYIKANGFEYIAKPGRLGPDFWPKVLLFLMIIMAFMDIALGIYKCVKNQNGNQPCGEEGEEVKQRYPLLLYIGIISLIAYVFVIQYLGFVLTTFAYLVSFMYVGRYRNHKVIWAGGLIGSVISVWIFVKLVYVSLPLGIAPFDQITILLYGLLGIQ